MPISKKRLGLGIVSYFLIILCISAGILIGGFFLIKAHERESLENQCDKTAMSDMEQVCLMIDRETSMVEAAAHTFVADNFPLTEAQLRDPEYIYRRLEVFLKANPKFSGAIIGFEDPYYAAHNGEYGFAPLVRRQPDGSLKRYQIGERHAFRGERQWYTYPIENRKEGWTESFLSEEGEVICDYSVPIYDATGQVMAVFAINHSLESMSRLIETVKPYSDAMVTVMDMQQQLLIHPIKNFVLRNISDFTKETGVKLSDKVMSDISAGRSGRDVVVVNENHTAFLYYSPSYHANWTVLLDCPAAEVYHSADTITDYIIKILIVGFSVMIVLGGLLSLAYYKFFTRNKKKSEEEELPLV